MNRYLINFLSYNPDSHFFKSCCVLFSVISGESKSVAFIQDVWAMQKPLAVLLTTPLEVKPNIFGGNVRHVTFQETHTQLANCRQAHCCKYVLVLAQCEFPC